MAILKASCIGFRLWSLEKAEEFINAFKNIYTLIEQRVQEASNVTSSSGGVVRILKCYPGDWQVHLMSSDETSDVVGVFPNQPTYKELKIDVKMTKFVKLRQTCAFETLP